MAHAVTLVDDDGSIEDRNTPTATYAMFSSEILFDKNAGRWKGGQFHDRREPDLAGQAGGPPLNPLVMNIPDQASVVARLMENSDDMASMQAFYAADVFEDPENA